MRYNLYEVNNMATVIMNMLDQANLTLSDVAKTSNVPLSTLTNAAKKPIESWSIRVLNAFAKGLRKKASTLLDELQPENYTLDIDDQKQIIQGVYIADKQEYFNMRAVVQAEHLEGWNPTKKDIEYVYKEITNPKPEYLKEYHKLFGE